jgi:hypothetical protein
MLKKDNVGLHMVKQGSPGQQVGLQLGQAGKALPANEVGVTQKRRLVGLHDILLEWRLKNRDGQSTQHLINPVQFARCQ